MAKERDNLVLSIPRELRVDMQPEFARLDETVHDVRRHAASPDLCAEAQDEKIEMIREGASSAIRFAANASRAHVDLPKQIADRTWRFERREGGN